MYLECIYVLSRVQNAYLIKLFLYFGLQTVLYLLSDSIHHGYLNKTGKVIVTKFNMVRKALNLIYSQTTIWLTYHSPPDFQQQAHHD